MMFRQAPYGPSAARTKIVLGTAQHGLAKFSARLCSGAIETIQQQDWCPGSVSATTGSREHVTLRLTDFEEDIGEYLYDDAAREQRQDINAFLRAHGRDAETGRWNIDRLVRLLARAEPKLGLTADSGCVGREAAAHHRILSIAYMFECVSKIYRKFEVSLSHLIFGHEPPRCQTVRWFLNTRGANLLRARSTTVGLVPDTDTSGATPV